jgi:hypothetical protein
LAISSNLVFSQDTLSADSRNFLKNSQIKISPSQIMMDYKIAEESWFKLDEYSAPTPFESAYNLNVFDYYNLNKTYDSDLKKEVFKQGSEYSKLFEGLKKIKLSYH